MPRKWQPRELRLTQEYIIERYPHAIHMTRVRLGALDQPRYQGRYAPEELRALGVLRRWADAIVITEKDMVLIETKIRPTPGVVSQLEVYGELVPHTPELHQYRDRRLRLELVFAIQDPVVTEYAEKRGIRVVHFCPEWVIEYLDELYPRERRPPQARGLLPEPERE